MNNNISNQQTNILLQSNWETAQIIDTAFIDDSMKEHHIYVSFERVHGLGARFNDAVLAEELTTAIRMTIEKLFKSKLVASHCVWKICKQGQIYDSICTYAPVIYKNDLVKQSLHQPLALSN